MLKLKIKKIFFKSLKNQTNYFVEEIAVPMPEKALRLIKTPTN